MTYRFDMNYNKRSLEVHQRHMGKLDVTPSVSLETADDLSVAYTPGVAEPCRVIAQDVDRAWDLTIKGRTVAVVTDGSSVLGLGNIGPEAGLPVMEGKAALFKRFANVDAFPICLATQNVDEIVETVKRIAPGFGGINLEDIAAPACFEVERRLIEELDIPVMHDDQHGTAVVVLAGLLNALKVVGKKIGDVKVVMSGAGAGGMGIANLLLDAGVKQMVMVDSRGMIAQGRERMNPYKDALAARINTEGVTGSLVDGLAGADVFVGVSQPGLVTAEMVRSMNDDAIVFALSNPVPEIMPEEARLGGAAVIATGRSDFPNQVNNVLAFPGIFKGALEGRLKMITRDMLVAAAHALSKMVPEPTADHIMPSPFAPGLAEVVSDAVQRVA
jgi:malate dehydrogenase (oxaloacetate-decarboxylating)